MNITERDKTIAISIFLILFGAICCNIDYYNLDKDVFPRIPIFSFLDEKPIKYPFIEYDIRTINSAYFLFIFIGIIFLVITLGNFKSKYLLKDYIIIFYHILKLKYYIILVEYLLFRLYRTSHNKVYHKT